MSESKRDWYIVVDGGRWNANALRLLPREGVTWTTVTKDARILMHERTAVAKVTRVGRRDDPLPWRARLYGFEFSTVPGVGAGRLGIKWSTVSGFATANEAVAFVDLKLAEMPVVSPTPEVLEPDTDSPLPF